MFPQIPDSFFIIMAALDAVGSVVAASAVGFVLYHLIRAMLFYVGVL